MPYGTRAGYSILTGDDELAARAKGALRWFEAEPVGRYLPVVGAVLPKLQTNVAGLEPLLAGDGDSQSLVDLLRWRFWAWRSPRS